MMCDVFYRIDAVSYTHLRAHETDSYLVCRLLLEKNITRHRNHEYNVFENEDIVLWDCSPWSYYSLFVSIRKHDEKNLKGFLIDTKRTGNNRLLEYDGDNIGWKDYKDCNDCLLFYFTKK